MIIESCSCPMAGFCDRHKIHKGDHYFRLCQDREDYRAKWDANRGPSQKNPDLQVERHQAKQDRLERARKHWEELHQQQNSDANWLVSWVKRIPQFGCSCGEEFQRILRANPPRFDDWQRWTFEVHNAVNAKLGKPEIEWNEACNLWNWNPQKE
jgi:hypothetical protein